MKKLLTTFAIAAVWIVCSAVPLPAQNKEHQQMAAELRMLQEQNQQVSLALAQSVAQLAEALKALNGRLDESNKAMVKGFADQELRVRAIGDDLSAIRERTQETDTRLRSLADEINALQATVTALPSLLTPPPAPAPIDPLDPNASSSAPVIPPAAIIPVQPPPSTAGLSPTRMLETAKNDYYTGQYSLALQGFDALIKTFPRTEAAGEAYFWTGETHSSPSQGRWADAVAAYSQVIQTFPKSNVAPDAYYKRGSAQDKLGQPDQARASWEALIKLYPDSAAALLAKQRLEGLRRQSVPTVPPPQRP